MQVNEDKWDDSNIIAQIRATDADDGNNAAIRYAIIGGNTQSQFAIDSMSGDVSLVKPLDYERWEIIYWFLFYKFQIFQLIFLLFKSFSVKCSKLSIGYKSTRWWQSVKEQYYSTVSQCFGCK